MPPAAEVTALRTSLSWRVTAPLRDAYRLVATVAEPRMTPGRIAAIITCHNLGRTLLEALESVERQTRPAAEIVVVDDASTDIYTRQVLARLERGGHSSRWHQARGGHGASAARNRGRAADIQPSTSSGWTRTTPSSRPTSKRRARGSMRTPTRFRVVRDARIRSGELRVDAFSPDIRRCGGDRRRSARLDDAAPTVSGRRIGGFDEKLPSYELLDFWASAIRARSSGRHPRRGAAQLPRAAGSGYRRSIQSEHLPLAARHFYAKHRAAVERHGLELIEGKEAFLQSQREYRQTLESRTASLEAELARLRWRSRRPFGCWNRAACRASTGANVSRVQPLSPQWGWDRGTPIDRHYIERFLETHRRDVRGSVLEVRDSNYTAAVRRRRGNGPAMSSTSILQTGRRPSSPISAARTRFQRALTTASSSRRRCSSSTTSPPFSRSARASCAPAGCCWRRFPV